MYKGKSVCVVIPAYNEEVQIVKVLTTLPPLVDHAVAVDDASSDDTPGVIQRLAEADPRIVLLRHAENQGVGGAIATGYLWARDHDLDIAVVMAGDGQMDPVDLPAILDPVADGQVDYAKANRLFSGEAYRKIPKVRFFGNAILSMLTKIASGYWHIADSQAGYAAIGKRALKLIDWTRMYKRYGQPNDILTRLNVYDCKVRDVIVEPVYGVGEHSKMKVPKVIFSISWLLLRLFFWRMKEKYLLRDFHPLVFFYLFGGLSMLGSLLFFIRILYLWPIEGKIPETSFLSFIFLTAMGFQSLTFAMWLDMERNKDLK
ncbi:MAG: glycosyltransferase family 2 protein [Magnetococcales bacterium]|nr:glycosyltransferase family 2 protein [Magnetococcales bacterium]